MIYFEIDAVVVNENTLDRHGLDQVDETEDGLVCCGYVQSRGQLEALMADEYVTILAVYVTSEYKDLFSGMTMRVSSEDGYGMDNEDNDMDKILEIILKT